MAKAEVTDSQKKQILFQGLKFPTISLPKSSTFNKDLHPQTAQAASEQLWLKKTFPYCE